MRDQEKYGLSGVRLAENLSDDEGAARGEGTWRRQQPLSD